MTTNYFSVDHEPEEDLKTLNDLKMLLSNYQIEELRAEAVKWVKSDIEEYKNLFEDILNGREITILTMNLINKWKKRFNITEEDLK